MNAPSNKRQTQRLETLNALLELDPLNLVLRIDATAIAIQTQNLATALSLVDAGLRLHPTSGDLHAHAAYLAQHDRRYAAALQHLDAALATTGETGELRYNKALIEFAMGNASAALESLQKIPAANAGLTQRSCLAARCWQELGDSGTAIETLEHLHAAGGATAESRGILALALHEVGRDDAAMVMADTALSDVSDQREALVARVLVMSARREYEGARTNCEAAVAAHPESTRAWLELSRLDLAERRYGDAADALHRVIVGCPDYLPARHALAWCHVIVGNLVAAELVLEQACQVDGENPDTLASLALVELMQGQVGLAEERIGRAKRIDPRCVSVRCVQALLLDVKSSRGAMGGPTSMPPGASFPALRSALQTVLSAQDLDLCSSVQRIAP